VSGKFVNNSGTPRCSDSPTFGTQSQPWCTITYGLSQLQGGDTLNVKAGTYGDYLNIVGPAGTAAAPTVIRAYPGDTVVLSGPSINGGRVKILQTSYMSFEGFTITSYNQGLFVEASDHITVRGVTVHDVGQQGFTAHAGSSYVTFDSCTAHDTGQNNLNGEGFYIGTGDSASTGMDNTHHVTLRGNLVYNTTDEGIEIKPGTHDCIVENNTLYTVNKAQNSYGAGGGAISIDEEGTYNYWNSNPNHIVRGNNIHDTPIAITAGNGGQYYKRARARPSSGHRRVRISVARERARRRNTTTKFHRARPT
jgi:parallel beta-helix repeat protein